MESDTTAGQPRPAAPRAVQPAERPESRRRVPATWRSSPTSTAVSSTAPPRCVPAPPRCVRP
ncbi:hypothetical protein QJS66_23405 (plasmid) [Kocuria rhizophila]|nr:hypothetical protein QJS66_23405 [Kocuria rhizophila]